MKSYLVQTEGSLLAWQGSTCRQGMAWIHFELLLWHHGPPTRLGVDLVLCLHV